MSLPRFLLTVLPAALCVLLAVVLFQRGGEADALPPPPAAVPEALTAALVQRTDVERLPAGSPERALVAWWHDVQYLDAEAAYETLHPSVQRSTDRRRFAQQIELGAGGFSGYKPQVVGRALQGREAKLAVNIIGFQDGQPSGVVPRAFALRRDGAAWRISDLGYLDTKAREGRAAALAAARDQRRQ